MSFQVSPTQLTVSRTNRRSRAVFTVENNHTFGIKYWIVPPRCLKDPSPRAVLYLPPKSKCRFISWRQPCVDAPDSDEIWIRYRIVYFFFWERIYTIKVKVHFVDDDDDFALWFERLDHSEMQRGAGEEEEQKSIESYFSAPSTLQTTAYTSIQPPPPPGALECKICYQEYNTDQQTPRVLQCGHTLCQTCAESILRQSMRRVVMCPFDRLITRVNGGDVTQLSKNYTVIELLEVSATRRE